MNNLGFYKTIVVFIKRVGGPQKFIRLVSCVLCSLVGASGTVGFFGGRAFQKRKAGIDNEQQTPLRVCNTLHNEELTLNNGDKIRIIARDGDAIIIEKIGDTNNPYVISSDDLNRLTDINIT